jgi:hypothetical protein
MKNYKPEVTGQVTLSLDTYEKLKAHMNSLQREKMEESKRTKDVIEASKHVSEFLTHLSRHVDHFDKLVDAFNETSSKCEIHKSEDGRFRVKIL